jgi:hypothetical protein
MKEFKAEYDSKIRDEFVKSLKDKLNQRLSKKIGEKKGFRKGI